MKTQELFHQLVIEGFKSELARHGQVLTDNVLSIARQALLVTQAAQDAWEAHEAQDIEEPEETQPSLNAIVPQGSR